MITKGSTTQKLDFLRDRQLLENIIARAHPAMAEECWKIGL
jgi:hypothetical protein